MISHLSHYFLSNESWKRAKKNYPPYFFLFIKLNPQACILYSLFFFSCVLPFVFFGCPGGIFYDKRTTNPVCIVWGWPSWVGPTGPSRKRAKNSQGLITARAFSAFKWTMLFLVNQRLDIRGSTPTQWIEWKLSKEEAPAMPTGYFSKLV